MPTCSWLPCSKPRLMTSLDRSSRPCTAHKQTQIFVVITVVCPKPSPYRQRVIAARDPRDLTPTAQPIQAAGLWLVKRQAAPDQQLNVGLARHTQTQLTCCWIASKPNGRRLLQGACEPSCSMLTLRARATRVRRVPRPFRAGKCSVLAAGPGAGGTETPKGPACSLVGQLSARRAATQDATRRRHRARRNGCGIQSIGTLQAPVLPPVYCSLLIACPILFEVRFRPNGLRRH